MKRILLFAVAVSILVPSIAFSQTLKWEIFGDLAEPRNFFQALPINDTLILVMGGVNYQALTANRYLRSCEFIDIKNKVVRPAPSMANTRAEFKALLTKDSNVIVMGGIGTGSSSVELYDRKTNKWTTLGNMLLPRIQLGAEWISNNEILIVGGRPNSSSGGTTKTEIFNISTKTTAYAADYPMQACGGVLGKTSTGEIWGFGTRAGGASSQRTKNVYRYSISTKKWDIVTTLNHSVQNIPLCNLPDGRLVCSNGSIDESPLSHSDQIMIEKNGAFASFLSSKYRTQWHNLIHFKDNIVLKIGGLNESDRDEKTTEFFDFDKISVSDGPELNFARIAFNVIRMPNPQKRDLANIYVIGGCSNQYSTALKSIEILEMKPSNDVVMTKIAEGCDSISVNFNSINNILKIEIDYANTNNVNIKVNSGLNTKLLNASFKLVDPSRNGYYTVIVTDEFGNKSTIRDTIQTYRNSLSFNSSFEHSGIVDFGVVAKNDTLCTTITIKNTKKYDRTINQIGLINGLHFQIKNAVPPIVLKPNEARTYDICFTPDSTGNFFSSFVVSDDCDTYSYQFVGKSFESEVTIATIINNCDSISVRFDSQYKISKITIDNVQTHNVTFDINSDLNLNQLKASFKLINPGENGFYKVIVTDVNGSEFTFSDSVYSRRNSLAISSSIENSGKFDFGTVSVNDTLCNTVQFTNKKNYDVNVSFAGLASGKYFKIKDANPPIILKPNESKTFEICFTPDSAGDFSDMFNISDDCDTYSYRFAGKSIESKIEISAIDIACDSISVRFDSRYKISQITIDNVKTHNIDLKIHSDFNNEYLFASFKLIDPNKNGYYKVVVIDENGSEFTFSDSVYSRRNSIAIHSPIENSGIFDFGTISINDTICNTITFTNTKKYDVTISMAGLASGKYFKIKNTIPPILLKPNESKTFDICFTPDSAGNFSDRFILTDDCDTYDYQFAGESIDGGIDIATMLIDCDSITVQFNSLKNISDIAIDNVETNNVNMEINTDLNTKLLNASFKLINPNQNGYYKVIVTDENGYKFTFSDSVFSRRNSLEISSEILTGSEIDFGENLVGDKLCKDITIKNIKNHNVSIKNLNFADGIYFSLGKLALPLELNPQQSKTIQVCFDAGYEGDFTDIFTLEDECDTYSYNLLGKGVSDVPVISTLSEDCGKLRLEIKSPVDITEIKAGASCQNTRIICSAALPKKIVIVEIELINSSSSGFFSIDMKNSNGNIANHSGHIDNNSGTMLKVVSELDSLGFYDCENITFSHSNLKRVLITNYGTKDYLLDTIYIFNNIEFSVPQSQLPLTIPAGDTVSLLVSYMPQNFGLAKDSILINGSCNSLMIRLKGTGIANIYSNESKCDVDLTLKTTKYNTFISGPYPNPTSGKAKLTINTQISNSDIIVVDSFGNIVQDLNIDLATKTTGTDIASIITIDLGNNNTGLYYIRINSLGIGKAIILEK